MLGSKPAHCVHAQPYFGSDLTCFKKKRKKESPIFLPGGVFLSLHSAIYLLVVIFDTYILIDTFYGLNNEQRVVVIIIGHTVSQLLQLWPSTH